LEKVIEIMCDTSCKSTDRFHFLGLEKLSPKSLSLSFGKLAVGYVMKYDQHTSGIAVMVQESRSTHTHINQLPLLGQALRVIRLIHCALSQDLADN
jgi:hypothetical protein